MERDRSHASKEYQADEDLKVEGYEKYVEAAEVCTSCFPTAISMASGKKWHPPEQISFSLAI
jgi:hypothetical protein